MNKCIYKGNVIYAFDVAKDFYTEKTIRESRDELFCCDPDCGGAVRYKHGTVRVPYFAHISTNRRCDYDRYANSNTEIFKKIRSELYDQLIKSDEYTVEMDVKILRNPSHYTPITVCGADFKFAIDIIDKTVNSNVLSERRVRYAEAGYTPIQIIIDYVRQGSIDGKYDLRYQIKYELNTSLNNIAVAADEDGMRYAVYKMDNTEYQGQYSSVELSRYNVFAALFDISALKINSTGLQVEGFDEKYEEWINSKREIQRKNEEKAQKAAIVIPEKKTMPLEKFIKTGKLRGEKINGIYEEHRLSDITINKKSPNYFGRFDMVKMKEKIDKAFSGEANDVKNLMNKMYHADKDEKEMFIRIFEEYLNSPESEENDAKIQIMTYIIEQAEIC